MLEDASIHREDPRRRRASVEDWIQMRERVGEIVSELEVNPPDFDPEDLTETRAFCGSRTTTSPSSATASTT